MANLIADQVLPEDLAYKLTEQALEKGGPRIAIDTETNGKDCRDGRGYAYGISMAYRTGDGLVSYYMPFRHSNPGGCGNYEPGRFMPLVQKILASRTSIFHNAKFDLVSLSTFGLDVERTNFLCTMKLAHLVDENDFMLNVKNYSLDECSKKWLKRPGKNKSEAFEKFLKVTGWEGMPPEVHGEYAAYDTYSTLELFEALQPHLQQEQLGSVWKAKQEFIRLIVSMEKNGVRVDTDFCDQMAEEGETRQYEIRQAWKKRYGRELNPMSRKDQQFLLIDTMKLPVKYNRKTGRPTFDKSAMSEYEEILKLIDSPLAGEILEYRGWNKSVSANYQAYVRFLSADGRLRSNFDLQGTVTGRLSSFKPNLQQIPKRGEKSWNGDMKKCFIPEDGYELIECDYSQLEFRLSAAFAREKALIEAFADPTRDVFQEIADQLGWTRNQAKGFVYATSYGAGPPQVSFVFNTTEPKAKGLIGEFYTRYPNLQKASRLAAAEVRRTGKIQLPSGRYRHFEWPSKEDYKAYNSLCQGTAADIVEDSMVKCAKAGLNDGKRSRMIFPVHDSVLFEIIKDDVPEAKLEIARIMSDVEPDFGVVFRAEPKKWGE